MTLFEQNILRDYAARARTIYIDPPYFTSADVLDWASKERRRRARNRLIAACAVIVLAAIVGYNLWRLA